MGTYDTRGGYPRSPREEYCEEWEEGKGCLAGFPQTCPRSPECKAISQGERPGGEEG